MRNYYYLLLLFIFPLNSFGQFNENAPWMTSDLSKKSVKKNNFKEITKAFDNYWKGKDYNKKGSGFKPFKRWENHWKYSLTENGNIPTPSMFWDAWSQKQVLKQSDISNWQSMGPYTTNVKTGQGRVNTFIVDPNNPDIFYVGAPAGGIWKSTDAGINWTPLSDYLPQIGVSGIAIDPNNSNIIYIATGDDDANDTYSVGVLKSTDAGTTWNTTGLNFSNTDNANSNEIYLHPDDSNILWVSTSKGFYKTTDAGVTWSRKIAGNIRDFKLKPGDPNTIYAVSSDQFYKSTDGGENFTIITSNLPTSSSRFTIDVSPANPEVIYILSANLDQSFQGLYKSTNSGEVFIRTAETDDIFGGSTQAWFDMALTVSPTDANIVFVGVLDIWLSIDGGNNFIQKNRWWDPSEPSYTHADIHFLRYFNNKLYAGTDGGIYESATNADIFTDLTENLNISQYYRIAIAKNTASNIAGGLQDNGGFAFSNNTWHRYHGGDGMDCAVDPNNPNTFYGFTQFGGSLNVTYDGGVTPGGRITSAPSAETGSNDSGGKWVTPLVSDSNGILYAGYSKLYKINNGSWEAVSSSVFGGDLDRIRISNSNNDVIFVSRSNKLFKSIDKGITFVENSFSFPNSISSVEINNQDENIIYITTSGFNGKVYKSVDGGDNWIEITNNLPNEPKLVIKHQNRSLINDLYIGTSLGVYHINDNMSEWEVFDNNLPNVPVTDIEFSLEDEKIIVSTYGRGVWQSPIEVAKADYDISLLEINSNNSTQCGGLTPVITVKNNGTQNINTVNIDYFVDGSPYNYTHNAAIAPNQELIIEIPDNNTFTIGEHDLKIVIDTNNDAFGDNNTLLGSFFINDSGEGQYINTFGDVNPDEWLTYNVEGENQLWEKIVQPATKFNNPFENAYITKSNGNYTDETVSHLVSPCYDLTLLENPILKFDMLFDIEQDWDVLYIEYTVDSGITWEILGTANDPNWYNSDFIDPHRPLTVGKQWTGIDNTVKEYSYDLANFSNEKSIIFRFVFASDQSENREGAAIDNFRIDASAILSVDINEFNQFNIYPNPSFDVFNIHRKNNSEMQISVYDVTGKLVFKDSNILNSNYKLNLSHVSKGLYILKINEGNKQLAKQIIVK